MIMLPSASLLPPLLLLLLQQQLCIDSYVITLSLPTAGGQLYSVIGSGENMASLLFALIFFVNFLQPCIDVVFVCAYVCMCSSVFAYVCVCVKKKDIFLLLGHLKKSV